MYQITWNTGETLTVTDAGAYLNTKVGLGANDTAGTVVGLLGPNNGQANDFTLPDGTVLTQPLSTADLVIFLNAWRVTQASSIFDYGPGQTTDTFTNVGYSPSRSAWPTCRPRWWRRPRRRWRDTGSPTPRRWRPRNTTTS